MADNESSPAPVNVRWLVAGAAAGLLAVAIGLLQQNGSDELPDHYAARVNDQLISRAVLERALQRFAADSEDAMDETDASWVLQRLVEEELLVQRGLSLGMARSENDVRGAIVQSLVASVTAEADAAIPDEARLQEYFDSNPERFSYSASLAVDAWSADDEASAKLLLAQLQNGDADTGLARRLPAMPAGPLTLTKLRDYLGPGITAAAANMTPGSSAVFARQGRWLIVRVVGKQDPVMADFDSIRTQVLLDYRRDLADRSLREYLDNLMQQADVVIAEP